MNFFDKLIFSTASIPYQKKYLTTKITINNPLYNFIQNPLPNLEKSILESEYLSLDFETTGLNAKKDQIISIGYTSIKQGKICLKESAYYLIYQEQKITTDSIKFHKITDNQTNQGIDLNSAFKKMLKAMAGKIIIAHHHKIEKNFLNNYAIKLFGFPIPCYYVDTMAIESRIMGYHHHPEVKKTLRLHQLKNKYNLPQYKAHHALDDAIGTAELFLAQMTKNYKNVKVDAVKKIISS